MSMPKLPMKLKRKPNLNVSPLVQRVMYIRGKSYMEGKRAMYINLGEYSQLEPNNKTP